MPSAKSALAAAGLVLTGLLLGGATHSRPATQSKSAVKPPPTKPPPPGIWVPPSTGAAFPEPESAPAGETAPVPDAKPDVPAAAPAAPAADAKPAAPPAPGAGTSEAAEKPGKPAKPAKPAAPAAPAGAWRNGAVTTQQGAFAYCVTENQYTNGLILVIGRNASSEINLAIGIPKAGMKPGTRWPVKVAVDDDLRRDRQAAASDADMLIVPLGKDEELFSALGAGKQLVIQGPNDTAAFQLKGTSKALADLRRCVDTKGRSVTTTRAAARAALPEALAAILAAAGLKEIAPMSLAGVPEDKRPADFAWRHGPLFGGVRESRVKADQKLADLMSSYVGALKQRCPGDSGVQLGEVESRPGADLATGTVTCTGKDVDIHVALLFYLTPSRLFTVFFHEAAEKDAAAADRARDSIGAVIRKLAEKPPAPAPAPKDGPG